VDSELIFLSFTARDSENTFSPIAGVAKGEKALRGEEKLPNEEWEASYMLEITYEGLLP
jgi:hypothetical protein